MTIREQIDGDFLYFFDQGKSYEAYKIFGSHLIKNDQGFNVGCEFVLYAPNAAKVNIIGEWNNFEGWITSMELIDSKGVWYCRLDGNFEWKRYKYEIITKSGEVIYKSDPFAFFSDLRPSTDSKVYDIDGYEWHDGDWMYSHPKVYDKPVLIYEMHLGSWRRKGENNEFYKFNEIAPMLVDYLKDFGYTHVELMPVYEHPLDDSWGYQGTSYFSPTSRYGVPKDFMYFVDYLHQHGFGVIMDWVPGHICKDSHGLYMFDGTPLYDYSNAEIRENVEWGTANLDLGKGITRSLLYSNAVYYMKYFHVDGFRVDAVSNIIYFLGNKNNGENTGALDFLRKLSELIFNIDDRVLLMAEDSSDFSGVTLPTSLGGLGFNYKWDMGWMNDTLKYFKLDPIYRKYHHHQLTFSMMYNYSEQFVLPLSHDEVVHMKGSLLNKMPGDYWQKFANYRLLIGYQLTHPGKKLLFMGSELAPFSEWAFNKSQDWNLRQFPAHDSIVKYFMDLTNFYKTEPALFELDHSRDGFSYIEADNCDQSVYVYARYSHNFDDHLVIVMNCTPNTYFNYRIGVPGKRRYKEVFNSDKFIYGGSGKINNEACKIIKEPYQKQNQAIEITLPPLGITILKMVKKHTKKDNN